MPPMPPIPRSLSTIDQSDLDPEADSDSAPARTTAATANPSDSGSEELYDGALDRLQRGEHALAEQGFRQLLERFPGSELADNAQYWIAESFLRRGDEKRALLEFRAVVERYPGGNKVPDALWKVALGLDREGDREGALEICRELVKRYPGTAAAEAARARLVSP